MGRAIQAPDDPGPMGLQTSDPSRSLALIKGVSLRLVVPTQPTDSPRLLVVGGKKGDAVQRVITLENQTK